MKISRLQIASVFICVYLWLFNLFAQSNPQSGKTGTRVTHPSESKPRFKSGLVTSGRVPIDLDISGAKKLCLIVTDGGNGYQCDWADWCEPKLIRADGSALDLTKLKWDSATCGFGQA